MSITRTEKHKVLIIVNFDGGFGIGNLHKCLKCFQLI